MATLNFDVNFSQSDNSADNGDISFNGQTKEASGRLDVVGQVAFATGFDIDVDLIPNCNFLSATVECKRTSESKMQVTLRISGFCEDGYGGYGGYGSYGGYSGYGGYGGSEISVEKVIENVSLVF